MCRAHLSFSLTLRCFSALPALQLRDIMAHAAGAGYTNLAVFNEDRTFSKGARVNGLLLVHLPEGPSAHFRLSNLVLSKHIKGHGRPTKHTPELILNNFTTALGHRVGRLFASLLPPAPEFAGRRVVTLHNQRDYVFFRHHRYVFEQKGPTAAPRVHTGHLASATPPPPPGGGKGRRRKKVKGGDGGDGAGGAAAAPAAPAAKVQARLQELGPRFTLKLQARAALRVRFCMCARLSLLTHTRTRALTRDGHFAPAFARVEPAEGAVRPEARGVRVGEAAAGRCGGRVAPQVCAVMNDVVGWVVMRRLSALLLKRVRAYDACKRGAARNARGGVGGDRRQRRSATRARSVSVECFWVCFSSVVCVVAAAASPAAAAAAGGGAAPPAAERAARAGRAPCAACEGASSEGRHGARARARVRLLPSSSFFVSLLPHALNPT
jgi:rRNA maturation protein Rpf1